MKLPTIYNYLNPIYKPFVSYMFITPTEEFCELLECIKNKKGVVRDQHGCEIEGKSIEFWYGSENNEVSVRISINEFIDLISPLVNMIIQKSPKTKCDIKALIESM